MSNSQGSHNFTPFEYQSNLNFSVVSTNDPNSTSYTSPNHNDAIRHCESHKIQFNQERVTPGPSRMSYPESSQRTDIRAGHQSSSYSFAGGSYFDEPHSPPAHFADLGFETISKISPTHYQQPLNHFPSYQAPSTSHHPDVSTRAQTEPHMASDHFFQPQEMSAAEASLSQSRKRGPPDRDEFQILYQPPSQVILEGSGGGLYHLPSADVESSRVNPMSAAHISSVSSIPMSNQVWPHTFSSNISSSTLESNYAKASPGSQPITFASSPFKPSVTPPTTKKKKKSKMHECEVCGKWFPRPSGLRTHMNAHNNLKPFPCAFPGCPRTFTVRSNAKRHLRTHGVDTPNQGPMSAPPGSASYTVGFNPPTIAPATLPSSCEMSETPIKLRWMPQSLTTRANAESLTTVSDDDDSDDDIHDGGAGDADWGSALPIPLHPVTPFVSDSHYEERNSYLDAPPYPYHPSQFRGLPGPVVAPPVISY